jgi:hypothetical protein
MSVIRMLALAAGSAAVAMWLAAPALADPGMPPCGMLSPVCNLVPTMPELDHDIDLTIHQPPAGTPSEYLPPADVCTVACI